MYNKDVKPRYLGMYSALLTLQTEDEFIRFFDDLCTVKEIQAMEQRYQVAELLVSGKNYNYILDQTGASSATVSRVNRSLRAGTHGYETAFRRLGLITDPPPDEMSEMQDEMPEMPDEMQENMQQSPDTPQAPVQDQPDPPPAP